MPFSTCKRHQSGIKERGNQSELQTISSLCVLFSKLLRERGKWYCNLYIHMTVFYVQWYERDRTIGCRMCRWCTNPVGTSYSTRLFTIQKSGRSHSRGPRIETNIERKQMRKGTGMGRGKKKTNEELYVCEMQAIYSCMRNPPSQDTE